MPAHSEHPDSASSKAVWYLGIDFGTTGVSAVLLNRSTAQQYPICWSNTLREIPDPSQIVKSQLATRRSGDANFRLPAVTAFNPRARKLSVQMPVAPVVDSWASTPANNQGGPLLQNFKPYLNIAIPFFCPKHSKWEPVLHLPSRQLVPFYWVRQALQELLATLTPKSTLPDATITVRALGLEPEILQSALQQLEGVVLAYPALWGDTYRFNLREAVLKVKLVSHPEQIFFLEDAIAAILAGLPRGHADFPKPEIGEAPRQEKQENTAWSISPATQASKNTHSPFSPRGGTLVINAGATTTELALVDLPDDLQELCHSDFSLRSLPYAGDAIDQDIFCQLLYPQLSVVKRQQLSLDSELELPLPGEPDRARRDRLAQLLQSSPLGQAVLKASGYLKLILQHQDEFNLDLELDRWLVKRIDLETKVIAPFIQQLNRELKTLLLATGISEQGIYQVLCIGGTATFGMLKKWLEQKLPNATLIQDADSPTGNWVAVGLATLPFYPQVLNHSQQQYSDYFLLLELLRAFPETADDLAEHSYSLGDIMRRLERRGVNTAACYQRLVRLIEGQLPGLIPSSEDASWLSQASKDNFYYLTIAAQPMFFAESDQHYRPNPQQQQFLKQYLDIVLSRACQKFEEPLIVKLDTYGQTIHN